MRQFANGMFTITRFLKVEVVFLFLNSRAKYLHVTIRTEYRLVQERIRGDYSMQSFSSKCCRHFGEIRSCERSLNSLQTLLNEDFLEMFFYCLQGNLRRVRVRADDAVTYDPKIGFTLKLNKIESPEGTYVCTARFGSYVRSVEYKVLSYSANYQSGMTFTIFVNCFGKIGIILQIEKKNCRTRSVNLCENPVSRFCLNLQIVFIILAQKTLSSLAL